MKQFLIIMICLGVFLSSVIWSSACTQKLEPVLIGAPALEQNSLLYIADSQGFFNDNGLAVTIKDYDNGMASINGILKEEVAIAEAAEYPAVNVVFQNQPVSIFAVNDRFENDYLIGRKDRGVTSVVELKGKRIGVTRGMILEFYLGRFLELNGLNLKDVVIVNTPAASEITGSIVKGEVDAQVAFQPFASSIQTQLSDKAIIWPVQNSQPAYGILFSNNGWLIRHNGTVKQIVNALVEAENFAAIHPDQAKAIVQNKLAYTESYIESIWSNHQFTLTLDLSLISAMQDEARWMIANNLTTAKTVPDFEKYIYLDGLKAVKPGAVNITK
jgi:NitT/TauT family transport system substrate-binding protein